MPSFTTLHPTLRDHWTNFEGDLNTQLANAQRDEYYTDADTHMEGFRSPDVINQQQHQVQQTEGHRLYPLTIPTSNSDLESNAPHTDTSSAVSTYGSNQGDVHCSSASSSHHHQQTHQHHHYQSDVLQSASSQSSSQEYGYHSIDPRYDPYAQPTYQHQHRRQHQSRDQEQQYYQTPQHHYATDTSRQDAATTVPSQYTTFFMSDYQDPSGRQRHWDDASRTYSDPVAHPTQPLGQYAQYDHCTGEPLQQRQQLHLQETWQSFGVYVGSPRPTP